MNRFKLLPVLLCSLLVFGITTAVLADDPGNPGDILGGGGSGTNAEGVPIDGGASVLAAAGAAVAFKKLKARYKK